MSKKMEEMVVSSIKKCMRGSSKRWRGDMKRVLR